MRPSFSPAGSARAPFLAGLFLLGSGCATEEVPLAVEPAPVTDPTPPPPELTPEAVPDPAAGRCARGFTQPEANLAFSAAAELDAGLCRFEGVRASGSRLVLRWTTADGSELSVTVGTAGCDEGEPHGPFTLGELPPGIGACGELKASLLEALTEELLPPPTEHERDGVDRPGPDGDGIPGEVRPATIPGEKASPESLPPAQPPSE